MKLRTLLIVVAALAVLSVIAFVIQRPAPPATADARLNQPLVDRALLEQAAKLRLTDQGKTVSLARQSDGTWTVTSYHDLPADFAKLTRLTDELANAKLQRLVTSNPDRIARLEFKDTKIELLDSSDKTLASLNLGKTAEAGGRFIRFDDEPKAFLASLNTWLDAESKNWADSTLVRLKSDDIAEIEIPFADGSTTTFNRAKKEDAWTSAQLPADHTVNTGKLTSVLSSLTSLRFSDTTALDDPKLAEAKPHSRTVKLTTFDGKTLSLTFARKPEEKKLKPPAPAKPEDAEKSGPAVLGSLTEAAASDKKAPEADPSLVAPEYETIPAGPVFVSITHSDSAAPINALMQKRAFQISDYAFTSLPQKPEDVFTAPPTPAPAEPSKE
jgi:hypothetical protein